MKKSVLFVGISLVLLLNISLILAANSTDSNTTSSGSVIIANDSVSQVDGAYNCLKNKIDDVGCAKLSFEEKVFSVLSTGKCKSDLSADSSNNKCWPKSGCTLKATAEAILALEKTGSSIDSAKNWLISQNGTPENLVWYLQIDSNNQTSCKIKYGGTEYSTTIDSDRRFTSGAGRCLTPETGREWWLKISSTADCLNKEFEIQCDKDFSSSLIFKKADSSVFHISENTHSAPIGGTTTEKVDSLCFKQGGSCNYEGSLWAALILEYLEQDVKPYLPYLITMSEDNKNLLPESFLYAITGYPDFRTELLQRQKSNKYWEETTGRKFYDTSIALLPLQYEEPQEKINTKSWLLEIQGKDGCWDGGNILTNAFILYSIWPRVASTDPTTADCEDSNYYCMLSIDCPTGNLLSGYHCGGTSICCKTEKTMKTCTEQNGIVCNSVESCVGGVDVDSAGLLLGESCCAGGGYCQEPQQQSECEAQAGTCRSFSCSSGETEDTTLACNDPGMMCCMQETSSGTGWLWWIVFLVILIILVVLGIVFREKLRPLWFKVKSKFTKSSPSSGTTGMVTRPSSSIPPRGVMPQRRIFPPTSSRPTQERRNSESHDELNDVLKKLKEMGEGK